MKYLQTVHPGVWLANQVWEANLSILNKCYLIWKSCSRSVKCRMWGVCKQFTKGCGLTQNTVSGSQQCKCVCVLVSVCVWERERERESVCVWVGVDVSVCNHIVVGWVWNAWVLMYSAFSCVVFLWGGGEGGVIIVMLMLIMCSIRSLCSFMGYNTV